MVISRRGHDISCPYSCLEKLQDLRKITDGGHWPPPVRSMGANFERCAILVIAVLVFFLVLAAIFLLVAVVVVAVVVAVTASSGPVDKRRGGCQFGADDDYG